MRDVHGYDEVLASQKRSLRTMPNTRLLGSSGARLWADYLELQPGFVGCFDFIHKCNIPFIFTMDSDFALRLELGDSVWKPSHLMVDYQSGEVRFREDKFITWDDCAVAVQTWENRSHDDQVIRLRWDERLQFDPARGYAEGTYTIEHHDFEVAVLLSCDHPDLWNGLILRPGETLDVTVSAAFGIVGVDSSETLRQRTGRWVNRRSGGRSGALEIHRKEFLGWFEQVPIFKSSDPLLDKTWMYRWYILRRNLADPKIGRLQHPLFYEGRSHKMSKTPWSPEGWEFSKLIPLSSPMHLLEMRWHHEAGYGQGLLRNIRDNQDESGLFPSLFVDGRLHSYANFMGWATYQFYLINRDDSFIREVLPALKKQVDGESVVYGNEKDSLLVEYNHKRTGKEYQPSYWYFHDYPEDCQDEATYTPLKRVDRSVYHYLNSLGVAAMCEVVGDSDAVRYRELACRVEQDLKDKMWDDKDSFFYDLHYQDDRKAYVKNVVGYYPFWAQITEPKHRESLRYLYDAQAFGTPCPLPSVSADCPVYAPGGGWQGVFIKGRNGCVWNGPSWPYTNSVVLDGLARESKRAEHAYDSLFADLLREYSWMHYSGRDLARPYLVEHYNSQTGEPISDEVDYNHSYYIELIVRHVSGLEIEADRIVLDPVDVGLDFFELGRVHAAGKILRITYGRPGVRGLPVEEGLRLYVDGTEVASNGNLQRIEYSW